LTKWKTGIGLSKSVLSKKKHKILEDYSSYIKSKSEWVEVVKVSLDLTGKILILIKED